MVDEPRRFNDELSFLPLLPRIFCFGFLFSLPEDFPRRILNVRFRMVDNELPNRLRSLCGLRPYTGSFEQMFHFVCDLLDVSL